MKRVVLSVMVLALLGLGISAYFLTRPQASPLKPVYEALVVPQPICSTWDFTPVNGTLPLSANFTFHACQGDAGQRFKFIFTGTELTGPHPGQNQTATVYVTVTGKCSFFTADINGDWKVNLGDLAAISLAINKPLAKNEPTDVNGDGKVDILDFACVAFYYGRSQEPF